MSLLVDGGGQEWWFGSAHIAEHHRPLELRQRGRDVDVLGAGFLAVEDGVAAPHAVPAVDRVDAFGLGLVAAVADEAPGLEQRRRAEVAVVLPEARTGRGAGAGT